MNMPQPNYGAVFVALAMLAASPCAVAQQSGPSHHAATALAELIRSEVAAQRIIGAQLTLAGHAEGGAANPFAPITQAAHRALAETAEVTEVRARRR
jgi:hypothetical protein